MTWSTVRPLNNCHGFIPAGVGPITTISARKTASGANFLSSSLSSPAALSSSIQLDFLEHLFQPLSHCPLISSPVLKFLKIELLNSKMGDGPWTKPFVGAHILLLEPGKEGNSWDQIPASWHAIRFDAIDVLFLSPFAVIENNRSFNLDPVDGGSLLERFKWVIRSARSKNPNVKIILEQFYGGDNSNTGFNIVRDDANVNTYANSVAKFIETWYHQTLPSITGVGEVSARVDGWDVDVEGSTLVAHLPKILTAVRASLDGLRRKLGAPKFSVSITPAWTNCLDASVAQSVDYINMQNYDGGIGTTPDQYKEVITGLKDNQLIWGLTSEIPWKNTAQAFTDVKAKAQAVASGQIPGIYTWRLNSDNSAYENSFQVWLFNIVHGVHLPDAKTEDVVARHWQFGGRRSQQGPLLSATELQ